MANYTSTSPYFQTGYNQFYLDIMVNRPIPKESDDLTFTINTTYQYRHADLWWVFYQRNPNTLQAPPMDFKSGTLIYLPKISTLKSALGF